jgi:signal transduction histidine kinase
VIEDRLDRDIQRLNDQSEGLSKWTFMGLWFAVAGLVAIGLAGSRILARSITDPIARLQLATMSFGEKIDHEHMKHVLQSEDRRCDELGLLASAYQKMASRISKHVRELETLEAIGKEINSIDPDGLDGVLRRITDRAVELVRADVCLVLLRNETMGCWIVEAASGDWNDRLKKSVMLWEEFPVCVQAYETRQPAAGERFRSDDRPQVLRRNLIGDSMFAVPLLAQGEPFGVLALLSERHRARAEWNERLAVGIAQIAAVAISNARLYELAQQRQRGLMGRLRELEHLAETLAHDLKGPGARMEELAKLLRRQYGAQVDERAARWLELIQENGEDLVRRVEGILTVARVGVGQGVVTAVDPAVVIDDVLKAQAGEIDRLRATVRIASAFPLVACHGAYLRQVFDNLLSNALKFARPGEPPSIEISAKTEGHMVCMSVTDRGIGIPPAQRRRVFDPFVRLVMTPVPGSGIGLTIVQRIVELYGGRVWIDAGQDGGCAVRFTLPCFCGAGEGTPLAANAAGGSDKSDGAEHEGVRGES